MRGRSIAKRRSTRSITSIAGGVAWVLFSLMVSPQVRFVLHPSRGAALLGALARSASSGTSKFLGKTAKYFLKMKNFPPAGAAQKARFSRNTRLMNDFEGAPAARVSSPWL
jgi:hypothetical protein